MFSTYHALLDGVWTPSSQFFFFFLQISRAQRRLFGISLLRMFWKKNNNSRVMQCQVISKIKRPHDPKHSNLAHNYASLRMDIKLSVIYIYKEWWDLHRMMRSVNGKYKAQLSLLVSIHLMHIKMCHSTLLLEIQAMFLTSDLCRMNFRSCDVIRA